MRSDFARWVRKTFRRSLATDVNHYRLAVEALEDRLTPVSFGPASTISDGQNATGVASGDFNNDGHADVALATFTGGYAYLSNAQGALTVSSPFTVTDPRKILVADVNNDGNRDIILANGGGQQVVSTLGNGDGTFRAPVGRNLPGGAADVALADFNGDGKLDAAVASNAALVLFNDSSATVFAPAVTYATNANSLSIAAGDFNGDGHPDLVLGAYAENRLDVLLNNGNGTFGAATSYPLAGHAGSLQTGDFNHDGRDDIVVAYAGGGAVAVLLANANGTFQPRTEFAPGIGSPGSVAVADLDLDGNLDLTVAVPSASRAVVFLGTGSGGFNAPVQAPTGFGPSCVVAGDLNGDGLPDLIASNATSPGSVTTALNTTSPTFAVSAPSAAAAQLPFAVTVTVKNATGGTVANYTGTVHFTSSDGQAMLPADYTFVAADAGVHTFSVILKTAGAQSVTATDTVTASITGAAPVLVSTATHFQVAAPASAIANSAFSVTVSALTAANAVDGNYRGTVHFTSSDGQAVMPANYTFTAADAGSHTFSVTLKSAGAQSVTATDTATTSIVGSANLTIGAAASFAVSAPASVATGQPFSVTVTAKNAGGGTATGYTGTVHFTSPDGLAVLPADYTFVAGDAGVRTFTVTLKTLGGQSVTVTDTSIGAVTGGTPVTVVKLVATPQLSTSAARVVFGSTLVFTARVIGAAGTPTGSVSFFNATTGAPLGTAGLDAGGVAQLTTNAVAAGRSTIRAVYSGDGLYQSGDAIAPQTVTAKPLVAAGSAGGGTVAVYDPRTGALLRQFAPFGAYAGGVKVATGDVDGDGFADLILMGGRGAQNGHVQILSGRGDFAPLADYRIGFAAELNIAAGDVNGDGRADVVLSTATDFDYVAAFSGATQNRIAVYSVFGGLRLGVSLAVGDFDGDGKADVIAGTGTRAAILGGQGAAVVVNGMTGARLVQGSFTGAFLMPLQTNGVSVAAADVNGDGLADVAIGTLSPFGNLGPVVAVYDAVTKGLVSGTGFAAYPGQRYGVRLSSTDRNGDGRDEIVTGFVGPTQIVAYYTFNPGANSFGLLNAFAVETPGINPSPKGLNVAGSL